MSIPRPASTPESAAAVVIAVVSSDARLLLPTTPSCDHGFIFGYLLDAVAETRSRSVARAAATFGPMFPSGDDGEPLLFSSLAAEPTGSFGGYRLARLVAVFGDLSEPPAGARLFSLEDLGGTDLYLTLAICTRLLSSLRGRGDLPRRLTPHDDADSAVVAGDGVGSSEHWDEVERTDRRVRRELVKRLEAKADATQISDPEFSEYVEGISSRVLASDVPSLGDVPPGLRVPPSTAESLIDVPFEMGWRIPPITTRFPSPPAQSTDYEPQSESDIFEEADLAKIKKFQEIEVSNLNLMFEHGEEAHAHKDGVKQKLLIIPQERLKASARGIFWDMRDFNDNNGKIKPVDFTAPMRTHLNVDAVQKELEGWPDQENFHYLKDGIQFKAAEVRTEMNTVFAPHLKSLAVGTESVEKEVTRRSEKPFNYLSASKGPQIIPSVCVPNGSVGRKYEPDRRRGTADDSFPRDSQQPRNGPPITSMNKAIDVRGYWKRPEDRPGNAEGPVFEEDVLYTVNGYIARGIGLRRYPRERKPSSHDVAHDAAILSEAALIFNEPMLSHTDDVADNFNQFGVHPVEWWNNLLLWRDPEEQSLVRFFMSLVMSFGRSANSNHAHAFSTMTVEISVARPTKRKTPFSTTSSPLYLQTTLVESGSYGGVRFLSRRATTSVVCTPRSCTPMIFKTCSLGTIASSVCYVCGSESRPRCGAIAWPSRVSGRQALASSTVGCTSTSPRGCKVFRSTSVSVCSWPWTRCATASPSPSKNIAA